MPKSTSDKSAKKISHPTHAVHENMDMPSSMSSRQMMSNSSPFSLMSVLDFMNNNFGLLVLAIGVFVIGFVSGSLWTENKSLRTKLINDPSVAGQQLQAPEPAKPLSDADWAEIQKDPVFVVGDKNAKVTMVEFTDYQCPFCGQFYTQTHGQLMKKYVDTGKMKIIVRDQALPFHQNANSAAQLVRCAAAQGKGLAMHDQLFTQQAAWSSLAAEALDTKYSELATAAGLNGAQMVSCVKEGKFKAAIDADGVLGNKIGAGGTPTFFVEKEPLIGALPLAEFEKVIEAKLAE